MLEMRYAMLTWNHPIDQEKASGMVLGKLQFLTVFMSSWFINSLTLKLLHTVESQLFFKILTFVD